MPCVLSFCAGAVSEAIMRAIGVGHEVIGTYCMAGGYKYFCFKIGVAKV